MRKNNYTLVEGISYLENGCMVGKRHGDLQAEQVDRRMDAKRRRGIVRYVGSCFGEFCQNRHVMLNLIQHLLMQMKNILAKEKPLTRICKLTAFVNKFNPLPQGERGNGLVSSSVTRVQALFAKQTVKNLLPYSPIPLLPSKKTAFTLAKTLITLGIIGVVAVLTIQPLIQKHNERVTVTKVKKMYSVISNAVNLWQLENACDNDVSFCLKQYSQFNCKDAFSGIEKNLEILEHRYQNEDVQKINWLPDESYGLNGNKATVSFQGVNKVVAHSCYTCHYLFKNGVTMTVQADTFKDSMFTFIDINGKSKPNRVGVDIFPIGIGSHGSKSKTVNPYYVEDNDGTGLGLCYYRNGNECSPDDGKSPTAYVLTHDALPHF